jgi:hypothetical protein
VPASVLQNHDDCTFVIDEIAATDLTRHKSPWLTGSTDWTPTLIKKAVIELALKLVENDEFDCSKLNIFNINSEIFIWLCKV